MQPLEILIASSEEMWQQLLTRDQEATAAMLHICSRSRESSSSISSLRLDMISFPFGYGEPPCCLTWPSPRRASTNARTLNPLRIPTMAENEFLQAPR